MEIQGNGERRSWAWDQIFLDPARGEGRNELEIGDLVAWILGAEQGRKRMTR